MDIHPLKTKRGLTHVLSNLLLYEMFMRLQVKAKLKPRFPHGTERIVSRFLIFPKTIGDDKFWLQWVKIKQRYHAELCRGADLLNYYEWIEEYWIDICFII